MVHRYPKKAPTREHHPLSQMRASLKQTPTWEPHLLRSEFPDLPLPQVAYSFPQHNHRTTRGEYAPAPLDVPFFSLLHVVHCSRANPCSVARQKHSRTLNSQRGGYTRVSCSSSGRVSSCKVQHTFVVFVCVRESLR